MEELKQAINAMKTAEKSLAKQGFVLRWKVRVKADQGFFRRMLNGLIAGTGEPAQTEPHIKKDVAEKIIVKEIREEPSASQSLASEKTQVEISQEQPHEVAQTEKQLEELPPVTSLNSIDAAAYLGVNINNFYNLVSQKRIPTHGEPGKRWYKIEELEQYREEREKRRAAKNS